MAVSSCNLPTTSARSALMKKVGRTRTAPELAVRRHLHALGLRFGHGTSALPGRPDIVLPRRRTVVFVHGCFWHGHDCVHGAVRPRTNSGYWSAKIAENVERDRRKTRELSGLGWNVEVIWECESVDPVALRRLSSRLACR